MHAGWAIWGAILGGLWGAAGATGQTLVDPARLSAEMRDFSAQPGERTLRCEIRPMHPTLDFSFRFETGFSIAIPLQQYEGPDHWWWILARVTPETGRESYLAARVRLPDVPPTTVVSGTFGGFLVGPGRYRVEWKLLDDEGRVCRAQWKIEAKLKHGERHVVSAIAPDTVGDLGGSLNPAPATLRGATPAEPDAAPFRLTVLLHAAPLSPRRLHLRTNDRLLLLSTLSALVERTHPTLVRLVVFNFDRQRVIYSNENFTLRSMGAVAQALNRLELDTVDVKTLANPEGHIDLLASMIAGETQAANPADAVVFLGPVARYVDKLPPAALPAAPEATRFYYIQYRPFFGNGPMLPDMISHAVGALKGRIFQIYTPGQFADAIRELERLGR